ncbi:MAG: glutamine--fructose-6-phosphate transaminase (isomerizing) [Clostridia bacterium]|nr:glutamine--fructose-6-phosphate transaminase (isomerizing) [Clostridia bacterium]
MCGIMGYTGERDAKEILLDGLKKLEYRGYDSAGIALAEATGIAVYKDQGKVAALEQQLLGHSCSATLGIGHTRWATHGAPCQKNAHPHRAGRVVLVHNGIIENEQALRTELAKLGRHPVSDTDTEIAAMVLDNLYNGDPLKAIFAAAKQLKGSYALGILFEDHPHTLYALRKDSPLIIGRGKGENFIASDIPAILAHTRQYQLLDEGEVAVLTKEGVAFYTQNGKAVEKPLETADQSAEVAEKGGYAHFMAKEIHQQPEAVRNTLSRYCREGRLFAEENLRVDGQIRIVACGSAYHAGRLGKYAIEQLARIPVQAEIASEFRYGDPLLNPKDLVIVISQSGETADSVAALRLAKERGIPTLAIVNVWGSTLAREADTVLYTAAGPEISVATTKAYTCQVVLLYLLALHLAKEKLSPEEYREKLEQLLGLPALLEKALKKEEQCKSIAKNFKKVHRLFFIGRGQDYDLAREGSLKLKEISYIHSEAYAAGELKHGTISLIEENIPVIALMTDRRRLHKTLSNVKEVRARGARVLAVTYEDTDTEGVAEEVLTLPPCSDFEAPIAGAVLLQLLAYYVAVERGNEVDQPRNLAKSVTVE